MTDNTRTPTTLERVLTALAELGPATAASIAESVGIAYPTTTPKLRELESTGHAERIRSGQRTTLWQLTGTGTAAASVAAGSTSPQPPSAAPADSDDPAGDESPQRSDPQPETGPESSCGPTVEDRTPTGQQAGFSTADTGRAGPPSTRTADPAGTATPAATPRNDQVPATRAEPAPEPMPESETAPAPPVARHDGPSQDQPSREPRVNDHADGTETNSTAHDAHRTPALTGAEAHIDRRRKPAQPRRRKGELRDEVLALLRRHRDTAYKVGEICKLINQARDGAQVNKASAGAVANALDKLVIAGTVTRLDTKVATYQAV
ncbi:hypothetical protein [Micromonospora echinospora]|uniref:hypothetical protein n=1 Tax=Micromonospora echinospora TaxID=1877 RepID=UPI003A85A6DA